MIGAEARGHEPRWCPTCKAPFRTEFARCPTDGAELVQTDDDLLLGQTLGNYVLESLLGEGAMARVYSAHHVHLAQKRFAVKVMIGDLSSTIEMRLRFAQEADATSRLHHPNVVSVVDFGKTDGGLLFLAMELVDGRSLAEVIEGEAPFAQPRALAIARQIALGLGHAHEQGLVHRDLKPENVIVSGDPERAQIVDFGLAIPVDDDRNARLTHVGLVVGTPIYAAPEQTHGEVIDHRADLFALGVTLYEMLAGVVPYQGGLAAVVQQNASDVLIPIAARSDARVAPDVEALVRRLMRRDPANRFQSASEVITAIDRALAIASAVSVASLPAAPVPRRGSRRMFAVLAAASLATIAVVVVRSVASTDASGPTAPPPTSARPSATLVPPVAEPEPAQVPTEPIVSEVEVAPVPVRPTRPERRQVAHDVIDANPAEKHELPTALPLDAGSVDATVAGNAVEDAAPAVVTPPPRATVVPEPIPAPRIVTDARTTLAALVARGPLPESEMREVIQRALPGMRACYHDTAISTKTSPKATARVSLSFDDTRRATNIRVLAPAWPLIAACVKTVAEQLRIAVAPDVGTSDVTFDISFEPVAP